MSDPSAQIFISNDPPATVIFDDGLKANVNVSSNAGPQGPTGPVGPVGPVGPDKNYVHNQSVSSAIWSIAHNLAKYPSVTVVDTGGTEVHGSVVHIDINNCQASFSVPFSGAAFCN